MSEHIINQDKREQHCLNLVKEKLNRECCFNLQEKEYIELKAWIKNAHLNKSSTKFPDIIFEDGFIEHFGITSSYEGKKGAQQTRESSNFKKNSETNFLKNLNDSEENVLTSSSFNRPFEQHSHFNIINSVKKKLAEAYRKLQKQYEFI